MSRLKNVVVPTRIQMTCPTKIHEKKALMSSLLKGRRLRMENHLKRTRRRDQKPVAAARSSSLVGRWKRGDVRSGRWARNGALEDEGSTGGALVTFDVEEECVVTCAGCVEGDVALVGGVEAVVNVDVPEGGAGGIELF